MEPEEKERKKEGAKIIFANFPTKENHISPRRKLAKTREGEMMIRYESRSGFPIALFNEQTISNTRIIPSLHS